MGCLMRDDRLDKQRQTTHEFISSSFFDSFMGFIILVNAIIIGYVLWLHRLGQRGKDLFLNRSGVSPVEREMRKCRQFLPLGHRLEHAIYCKKHWLDCQTEFKKMLRKRRSAPRSLLVATRVAAWSFTILFWFQRCSPKRHGDSILRSTKSRVFYDWEIPEWFSS